MSYSYEQVRVNDINAAYLDPVVLARNPFLRDSLLIGSGRRAHRQQGLAERRLQHRRPADLPDHRQAAARRRSTSPGSAATPTSTSRALEGIWFMPAEHAGCRSACAAQASTSTPSRHRRAADLREALPRRRVQRPRLRHPHDRPARPGHRARARRQQEPAVQRRRTDQHRRSGAPGALLRRRPGAAGARRSGRAVRPGRRSRHDGLPGRASPWTTSRRRPAPKSASSCRC